MKSESDTCSMRFIYSFLLLFLVSEAKAEDFECGSENDELINLQKVIKPNLSQEFCKAMINCSFGNTTFTSDVSCDYSEQFLKNTKESLSKNNSGDCGLTDEELSVLGFYMDSGFGCLNQHLRNSNSVLRIDLLVERLNSGLEKLPRYEGIVRRGAYLPDSVRDQHIKGAIINYEAYTSTSNKNPYGGIDQFIIVSKSGRPVVSFAGVTAESEILFTPNTKFQVLDRWQKGNMNIFVMKEIDGNTVDHKELLKKIKKHLKMKSTSSDFWSCPEDKTVKVKDVVTQEHVPDLRDLK